MAGFLTFSNPQGVDGHPKRENEETICQHVSLPLDLDLKANQKGPPKEQKPVSGTPFGQVWRSQPRAICTATFLEWLYWKFKGNTHFVLEGFLFDIHTRSRFAHGCGQFLLVYYHAENPRLFRSSNLARRDPRLFPSKGHAHKSLEDVAVYHGRGNLGRDYPITREPREPTRKMVPEMFGALTWVKKPP